MIIREFNESDLWEYTHLVNLSRRDRPNFRVLTPEQIVGIYNKHPCYGSDGHLVAIIDGRMVGEAVILPDPLGDSGKCSDIASLHLSVISEERGKGIGQKLLEKALASAASQGICRIETAIPLTCTGMKIFYENHGFEKKGDSFELQRNVDSDLPAVKLIEDYILRPADMQVEKHDFFRVWDLAFSKSEGSNLTFVADEIEDFLAFPDVESSYFVVERKSDSMLVGAISAYYDTTPNARTGIRNATIEVVGVIDSERRKGIGKALGVSVLNWMATQDMDIAMVSIHQTNAASLGLFRSLGFLVVKEEHVYSYAIS